MPWMMNGWRFPAGRVVMTRGAWSELPYEDVVEAFVRHLAGDWGELDEHDRQQNELGLQHGGRLFSRYVSRQGTAFWIITEWDRSVTTVLLPMEY